VPELLLALLNACSKGWKAPESLTFIAVGGAKVAPALIAAAREQGLPVYEGYGLSECSSVVCLNSPGEDRIGSVGKPLEPFNIYTQKGEIHIPNSSFLGYVNDPVSWRQKDLATGDLGHIDSEGFVFIEGRRGNRLISSFGRNISPEWIESELLAGPLLAQAVVIGDAQPYCTALIYPRQTDASQDEIEQWIESVNQHLPDYGRIRRWRRLAEPMSPANHLMTSNGRPRRAAIEQHFGNEILALYPANEKYQSREKRHNPLSIIENTAGFVDQNKAQCDQCIEHPGHQPVYHDFYAIEKCIRHRNAPQLSSLHLKDQSCDTPR